MSAASSSDPVRRLFGGGAFVLGADALQLPGALVLAAYLSRRLGAEGLALYLLAGAVVSWIELAVSALFSRSAVQLIAETREWHAVASLVLRWHLKISLAVTAALWLVVWPFDRALGIAELKPCLLLFSLEIPLFSLARSHTHVLVGLERFRERAWAGAARWLSRPFLAIALVELGWGVNGAVLGAVASTALELIVARSFVRPPFGLPSPPALRRRLLQYSLPLFLHGVSLQLFNRVGLLLLVPLGASVAAAGVYGAADALLRLRRVLGQSLTPLLLSTLAGLVRDGQEAAARELARSALRWVLLTVAPVAVVAGAAPRIMAWLYGEGFRAGGSVLALLIAGAPFFLVISVAAAILIAAGRPRSPVRLTAPMVPIALLGCAWAVPRFGAVGAAAVTTLTVFAAALASLAQVYGVWRIAPPAATVARSAVVGAALYAAAAFLPYGGAWLLLEIPALVAAGGALYLVLGEATVADLGRLFRARDPSG